jgi:hypothetical protein
MSAQNIRPDRSRRRAFVVLLSLYAEICASWRALVDVRLLVYFATLAAWMSAAGLFGTRDG